MSLTFACRACYQVLAVPDGAAGKLAKCICGQLTQIPPVPSSTVKAPRMGILVSAGPGRPLRSTGAMTNSRKYHRRPAQLQQVHLPPPHPVAGLRRNPWVVVTWAAVGFLLLCIVVIHAVRQTTQRPSTLPLANPAKPDQQDKAITAAQAKSPTLPSSGEAPTPTDKASAEAKRWEKAKRDDIVRSYQDYLAAFPGGQFAREANSRIDTLKKAEMEEDDRRAALQIRLTEEADWKSASARNTVAGFQQYLIGYPRGRFAVQAQDRIEDLRQAALARQEAERQAELEQQGERDWLAAAMANTAKSYKHYVQKYPKGRHVAEAQQRLQYTQQAEMAQLAAACAGKGVPQAAAYQRKPGIHKAICLTPQGTVHEWNNLLPTELRGASVEETELVIIITPQFKTFLSTHAYMDPRTGGRAPSVSRYGYHVWVRVVAARTGIEVARNYFLSAPGMPNHTEAYDTTEIGVPVVPVDFYGAGVPNWLGRHICPGR